MSSRVESGRATCTAAQTIRSELVRSIADRVRPTSTEAVSQTHRHKAWKLPKATGTGSFCFEDASRTEIFDAHLRETWRQGLDAIKWEMIDAFQDWGFRLADISIPVSIWHGGQDPWVKQEYIDFQVRTSRTAMVDAT